MLICCRCLCITSCKASIKIIKGELLYTASAYVCCTGDFAVFSSSTEACIAVCIVAASVMKLLLALCAVMSGLCTISIVEGVRVQQVPLTAPCPADMSGVQTLTSLEASISKYQVSGHVRLSNT